MNASSDFNVAELLDHDAASSDLVAPTIYRLASSRKLWRNGERVLRVALKPTARGDRRARELRIFWDLEQIEHEYHHPQAREDLRKLANAKHEEEITTLAAIGTAFGLMSALMPKDEISRVSVTGDRGDFFLNNRRDEMVEISGTMRGDLSSRFSEKRQQVLLNETLRKAIVCVSRFVSATSRLERVK
jgi:hypothetical protein